VASIEQLVNRLRQVLEQISTVARHLEASEDKWHQAAITYATVLAGSAQPETRLLAETNVAVVDRINEANGLACQAMAKIEAIVGHCQGETSPGGVPDSPPVKPIISPPYQNPHGDNYPPEAAIMAAALPKRVKPSTGDQTIAIVRVNGRIIPGTSSGGREAVDQSVADAAMLLRRLGFDGRTVNFLKTHAEIKVLARLQQFGVRHAEVTINNTPCGVESFPNFRAVCDKVLEGTTTRLGMTLTVYGSYQDNRPYKRTYGGQT
jgi:hypothetical protein